MSGAPHRVDAYLLELGAGIILLAIVNVMFLPHDIGFLGWQPNPALALVAVIAARHGLREGIMAALVMAGLELACRLGRAEDLSWSMMRSLQTYVTPLLLLSTGFLLGAIREERRRETEGLGQRVRDLEDELADQAVRFMAASEAKHELERRVADEGASLSNLYAAAQALETLDIDRLYPAIPQTARRFLQADACQLYLLDGDVLRLRAAEGAPPPLTELNPGEGLAGLAIRQGKAQSLRDLMTISTADELQRAPFVMAAPLTGREGALLGCLTVTRLPFLRLNPVALDRLALVANWAALAVDNARTHERTRARTIQDDLIRAYTYAYYQQRLAEEEARAARYDRPLSVLIFRIRQLELIPAGRRAELGHVLSLVFNHSLRDVDIVCRYATDDAFAVILPETGSEGAAVVATRIEREIAAFQFAPYADEDRDLEFTVRVLPVREPGQGPARGRGPRG